MTSYFYATIQNPLSSESDYSNIVDTTNLTLFTRKYSSYNSTKVNAIGFSGSWYRDGIANIVKNSSVFSNPNELAAISMGMWQQNSAPTKSSSS